MLFLNVFFGENIRAALTTYNIHMGVGRRFRFLLVLALAIMIILPSFFSVEAQEVEEKTDNEARDWTYYFQLPASLILIFGLMVIMLAYARKVDE